MRIATYNVEWFTELFSRDNRLLLDQEWSRRYKVKRADQGNAIAAVMKRVDADLMLIVEAPNTGGGKDTKRALESFAKHFGLRQTKAIMGFVNDTHQELAVMYDPLVVDLHHDPKGEISDGNGKSIAPRFDGKFLYDVDVDGKPETHVFSKPPLELAVKDIASGKRFRLIGVHTKSKSLHGANTEAEAMTMMVENRRKQLAQCIWIRQRVDAHLDAGDPLIVLGDFNDGPTVNGYETLFARSGVQIVMGEKKDAGRCMIEPHASIMLDPHQAWAISSARFYIGEHKRYLNALLDYVMLSEGLAATGPSWRIWHPFDDPECFKDVNIRDALLTASDHFPVSVDLKF